MFNQKLTFSQKFGIRFYSFAIAQSLTLILLFSTGSSALSLSFIGFFNVIGNFLPIKAKQDRHLSKIQNSNKWLLGPLILSCFTTPVILAIFWRNYHWLMTDSWWHNFQLLMTFAFLTSGSIDASHELLHRSEKLCYIVSYVNLFLLQFTIYPTEHLYMHHKKVGTPQDPITCPLNKSLYSYYFNALFSCYKFNYQYCKKTFTLNVGLTLLYNLLLFMLSDRIEKALTFSCLSYLTLLIMEAIEYIEHYGLVYRTDEKEKPVTEISSWNTSENELLNCLLFRFQRHSDHHMNAYKIYPTMELTDKMPQFPFDFVSGIIIATLPFVWFKLINPLCLEITKGTKVSEEHRQMVKIFFKSTQIAILGLFILRILQFLLA